jgi:hypothetical protein
MLDFQHILKHYQPAFGDCVDAFVIADLTRLLPKKKGATSARRGNIVPINGTSQGGQALPPKASIAAVNR